MPEKDYFKGASYRLYVSTTGNYASPTWNVCKAAGDLDLATNPDDVVVPERGMSTGHLAGEDDPALTFILYEDRLNAQVTALVDAMRSKGMIHIAVSRGDMSVSGTKYWHMEALLFGTNLGAARGEAAQYDVAAYRHANSDHDLEVAFV